MLSSFIRKKKKGGTPKTFNIESIQSAIEGSRELAANKLCCAADVSREQCSDIVNKEENFSSPHKKQKTGPASRQLFGQKGKKRASARCLEDYNIVSESSFTVDNAEILPPPEDTAPLRQPCVGSSHWCREDPHVPGSCMDSDVELRKLRVMNHATKNVEVKYNRVNSALYLPRSFKMLSSLYKIISTIYNFNKKRDLSLIFTKYKDSIERLFKHRVEVAMLEQLNFIANGTVSFVPIEVLEEGVKSPTFRIDIVQSIDIDFSLFNYLCEAYRIWLARNGLSSAGDKMHRDFLAEDISIPTKAFLPGLAVSSRDEPALRKIAREKTGSILDRIREKERLRREEFVQEQTVNRDYEGKLASLFEIGGKRAVKMSDILFKMGGFDCRAQILKALGEKYVLRRINDEEYIVKNE